MKRGDKIYIIFKEKIIPGTVREVTANSVYYTDPDGYDDFAYPYDVYNSKKEATLFLVSHLQERINYYNTVIDTVLKEVE